MIYIKEGNNNTVLIEDGAMGRCLVKRDTVPELLDAITTSTATTTPEYELVVYGAALVLRNPLNPSFLEDCIIFPNEIPAMVRKLKELL